MFCRFRGFLARRMARAANKGQVNLREESARAPPRPFRLLGGFTLQREGTRRHRKEPVTACAITGFAFYVNSTAFSFALIAVADYWVDSAMDIRA
jgi:hypothetical protein